MIYSVHLLILGLLLFSCDKTEKGTKAQGHNNFDGAVKILTNISGSQLRNYSTYDFGRQKDKNHHSIIVPYEKSLEIVASTREKIGPNILVYLNTTRWLGEEKHEGDEIVIVKSQDQFDSLKISRTNGTNHGLSTEDIIKKLKEFDKEFGIEIFSAETDKVGFALESWPIEMKVFCKELYKLCPDIVDQGSLDLETLEKQIRTNGQITLWWD